MYSYYVFIPDVLPDSDAQYQNDYACLWKFPSLGECERYEIKIYSMNLQGVDPCTCSDHVLLEHSGDQAKCINGKSVGKGIASIVHTAQLASCIVHTPG